MMATPARSAAQALLPMSLFALQHSLMARPQFKKWWTQFVPTTIGRSTYVLFASLALALLLWQWRPMPMVVWQIREPHFGLATTAMGFVGWLVVLSSTF
jgi:protein-S-isoprenylcysteine O-methyltransferase Ste14